MSLVQPKYTQPAVSHQALSIGSYTRFRDSRDAVYALSSTLYLLAPQFATRVFVSESAAHFPASRRYTSARFGLLRLMYCPNRLRDSDSPANPRPGFSRLRTLFLPACGTFPRQIGEFSTGIKVIFGIVNE